MEQPMYDCLACGENHELIGWSLDELGYYAQCKYEEDCGTCDITIEDARKVLVPDNTKVITNDGQIGVVWFNDFETSNDSENINYAFTPENEMYKEYWSDTCQWLLRNEFEIIEQ